MKILFINCVCGVGSTGRIVIDLMQQAKAQGHTVKVACSAIEPIRGVIPDEVITVGSKWDYYVHNILSRLTDKEGLFSKAATRKLVRQIQDFNPDIIHLHNLHGHWINYEILFDYLAKANKKVIWTLHDCWAFTGHCAHFSLLKCEQWKTHCTCCPGLSSYPKCYGRGNALQNFERKKRAFTSVKNMMLVTPSSWLKNLVRQSFLEKYPIEVVHNKINQDVFYPRNSHFKEKYNLFGKILVLGVANVWSKEKGFEDFLALRKLLSNDKYACVMVGVSAQQLKQLPNNIIGIQRTHSPQELAEIYSAADVFVNMTYQDNYPTVNLEAISCASPVISYQTGGSCEAFDAFSGIGVPQGNIQAVADAISQALTLSKQQILHRANEFKDFGNYQHLYQ